MAARDGSETKSTMTPTIRRQPSIEEDLQYTELVGARSQAPAEPPTHEAEIHSLHGEGKASEAKVGRSDTASRMTSAEPAPVGPSSPGPSVGLRHGERQVEEALPPYSCDIQLEGVFLRKMEIEEATRRAAKRSWKHVYVVLQGTSLRVYRTRRKWWESGLANSIGPGISPDNLPWIKRGPLERSYSLLYADAGIAADYRKRRYVIRVRAETDQFLLSCIELENFVRWLEALFAAIDIAAPIEDRDFPRDQSIPREQRRRQQRQQQRQRPPDASADAHDGPTTTAAGLINAIMEAGTPPTRYAPFGIPAPPPLSSSERPSMAQPPVRTRTAPLGTLSETSSSSSSSSSPSPSPSSSSHAPSQILDIDPTTGKWAWSPSHVWTARHDLLYARLCYAVLLYRSPRKSDLVVRGDRGGTLWRVNWQTGSMVRALPPAYGETLGGRK